MGAQCFLNVLVVRRNFTSASMPSVVLMMSDVTRSSEVDLRIWCCSSYIGQVAMMWSHDWSGLPHGQEQSSVGMCLL